MSDEPMLRPLVQEDVPACEQILAALPEWFGIPDANREYITGLPRLPAAVIVLQGAVVGFMSLRSHGEGSSEIEVMAVDSAHHRHGIGRKLIGWALEWCAAQGAAWLHVKTRGPAPPDPDYEKTRRFYRAVGFDALFESTTLWGPEDAALILVRRIEPARAD